MGNNLSLSSSPTASNTLKIRSIRLSVDFQPVARKTKSRFRSMLRSERS